jgi:hypothetical protein
MDLVNFLIILIVSKLREFRNNFIINCLHQMDDMKIVHHFGF